VIRVNDLTSAERLVWEAFPEGREVDFQTGDPVEDDPSRGADWGPERVVRAEVVRALLLDARKPVPGHISAVRVVGVRVAGPLDLDNADFRSPLRFADCLFTDEIRLFGTKSRRINLLRSHFPGMSASGAVVDGSMRMTGCRVSGRIQMVGTRIAGALMLEGAHLSNPGDEALTASRLRVDDDLLMNDGFTAEGRIVLRGATIGGDVLLQDAELSAPGGRALHASRIRIGGDLMCDRLQARGEVGFPGAEIAGLARFVGATLINPGMRALYGYQARVGADLQCSHGFRSDGEVHIKGIRIAGRADFDGAVVTATDGGAIEAANADVTGHVYCTGLTAVGAVRFSGARIGGILSFQGADISAGRGVPAGGSRSQIALTLNHLRADELKLRTARPPAGRVVLSHAVVDMLSDSPETWPDEIHLNGFTYDKLDDPGRVEQRITWLGRNSDGYLPQPYEQLASVYRRMGHDGDARRVLLAKQLARRRTLSRIPRIWGVVQETTVGYGYRPERAVGWLALLLAVGTTVFGLHHPSANGTTPGTPFNPLIYSLDLLLPVINFGQSKAFTAVGGYQWPAYLLTAAGWILSATIAAGLARAVNRA
jgi:hypothetical protein